MGLTLEMEARRGAPCPRKDWKVQVPTNGGQSEKHQEELNSLHTENMLPVTDAQGCGTEQSESEIYWKVN